MKQQRGLMSWENRTMERLKVMKRLNYFREKHSYIKKIKTLALSLCITSQQLALLLLAQLP